MIYFCLEAYWKVYEIKLRVNLVAFDEKSNRKKKSKKKIISLFDNFRPMNDLN